MKIAFLTPVSLKEWGGVENWIFQVAQLLSRRHQVAVVSNTVIWKTRMEQIPAHIFTYYEIPTLKITSVKPSVILLRAPQWIKNFDVLYLYHNSIVYSYQVLSMYKQPIILGIHVDPLLYISSKTAQKFYQWALQFLFRKFKYVCHVLSRETCIWLQKIGITNLFPIPNGVNTRVFQLCKNSLNSQSFNVLFSGRLTWDKGTDTLIEIIQHVNRKLKLRNIKFIITGSGPFEDIIKNVAQKCKNVEYLGFIPREDLPNIYGSAHLFLIPSKSEGMPLRLLEAQSCGLPAVGSNILGISDIIINGKTGQLVNMRNVEGFAKAIKSYYELWLNSPFKYHELNKAIRSYIVRNYDWNIIMDKIEEMFKKCAHHKDA